MKQLRKTLFWVHLVLGLAAGSTIAVTVFTGACMAFEKQILAWAEGDARRVPPPTSGDKRVALDPIIAALRQDQPRAQLASVVIASDPQATIVISLGRTNTVYVNPYTGDILPQGAPNLRAFFQLMLRWHRWLGVGAPSPNPERTAESPPRSTPEREGSTARPTELDGKPTMSSTPGELAASGERREGPGGWRGFMSSVMGISAAIFGTLSLTGLYLWWPRTFTAKVLSAIALPNLALRGKPRDWNWHNALGFWAAPWIVIMSITGISMAFRPFGNVLYGTPGNQGPGTGIPPSSTFTPPEPGARPLGVDALLAKAMSEVPNWESMTLRFGGRGPRGGAGPRGGERGSRATPAVSVAIREKGAWSPLPQQLQLHPYTAEVLSRSSFSSQVQEHGLRRAMRSLNRTLHTGEAGGLLGQSLAFFACVSGGLLVYTGFALSWRRFFKPKPNPAPTNATSPEA